MRCDQGLVAPLQGLLDLSPEPHGRGLDRMPADQLAVEPGGGIGSDLPVKVHGGVNLDHELARVLLVVGRRLLQEVFGDLPMVGVQPLDDTCPAQSFEAPDVGLNMALDVAAGNALGQPGDLGVLPRLVEPLVAGGERGDGLIHRPCRRLPADREDGAEPGILGQQRCVELDVVYAGIDRRR